MGTGRRRVWVSEEVRKKIQTSQLINRLEKNALAEKEFMTQGQIASARILLDKSIPNLQATQISGDSDNPVIQRIERVIVRGNDAKAKE